MAYKATTHYFVVAKHNSNDQLRFLSVYEPNRFLVFTDDIAQAHIFRNAGDAKKQIENCSGSEGCLVRKVVSQAYSVL